MTSFEGFVTFIKFLFADFDWICILKMAVLSTLITNETHVSAPNNSNYPEVSASLSHTKYTSENGF